MNNATRENSIHPVILSVPNQDDSIPSSQKDPMELLEPIEIKGILSHLNQISFSPRVVSIRAVLKYAHEKNEAVR